MKKPFFDGLVFLAFVLGAFYWIFAAESEVFLSTTSPDKTYTVKLTGDKSSPLLPFYDHRTNFNLFKNSRPLVENEPVARYDFLDSSFGEMYPEHVWSGESVLRLGSDISESEKSSDFLTVSNRTNKNIKYLRIEAGDMLFIFETPPHSINKYSIPYLGDLPWIMAEGEFADGRHITWNGVNFLNDEKRKNSLRYCVSVTDDGLKIESPLMKGFNRGGSSYKPNIAEDAYCDFY
jgi:hypothetical protein